MIEFNLSEIEAELRAVFPSLRIASPLRVIGSGFNSLVIEAGGTIVFRIGKNSAAQAGYMKEVNCLSKIAPNLPFLIPDPQWHIKSSRHFPFGIIGYHKVPGLPLHPTVPNHPNLSRLAVDTAKFLFELHCISPGVLQPLIADAAKWKDQYQRVLPVLKDELTSVEFGLILQWWDRFLDDPKMQRYDAAIQHGDLWYENMLVDPGMEKLIGVIDWERLSIGDPAQDFATLFHVSDEFVRLVIQAYQALGGQLDENFEYRLQRLWEAREFDGLEHAVRFDDPMELNDSLHKLRHGPILKNLLSETEEK